MKQIIILAAGKGSRMESELPKVMHEVAGKPMLRHVVDNSKAVSDDLILVYSDHIREYLSQFSECKLALQEEQLGTAHAIHAGYSLLNHDKYVAVIYGDNPLITSNIISNLFERIEKTGEALVTLAFNRSEPNQYGRIVTDSEGNFLRIVESKFANAEEKQIQLCNSGVMVFAPGILKQYLHKCLERGKSNPDRELYITDIVEICVSGGEKLGYYVPDNSNLVIGVNTKEELEVANNIAANTAK